MMNYTVFKAKILTNSSIEITNASLFEIFICIYLVMNATIFEKKRSGS